MATYRERKELHRRLVELVSDAREDLREIYAAGDGANTTREKKAGRLALLESSVREELRSAGRNVNHWLTTDLNNARLLPMSLYDGFVPAFRRLLAECDEDLPCFYARAEELAEMEPEDREARLHEL